MPLIGSYFGRILLETFWGNFIFFLNFGFVYLYESQTHYWPYLILLTTSHSNNISMGPSEWEMLGILAYTLCLTPRCDQMVKLRNNLRYRWWNRSFKVKTKIVWWTSCKNECPHGHRQAQSRRSHCHCHSLANPKVSKMFLPAIATRSVGHKLP